MNERVSGKKYSGKKEFISIILGTSLGLLLLTSCFSVPTLLSKALVGIEPLPTRSIISSSLPMEQLWQVEIDEPVNTSPVIADGIVIVPTSLAIYGLDIKTGHQLWRHKAGPYPSPPPINTIARRVIYGDGNYVITLNIDTGEMAWQYQIRNRIIEEIVIGQEIVYVVAKPTQIEALDLETGKLIWSVNGYDNNIPSRGPKLFLHEDDLYIFTEGFHILDSKTGKIKGVIEQNIEPSQLVNDRFYGRNWVRGLDFELRANLKSPSSNALIDNCENFVPPYIFSKNQLFVVGRCGGVYALDNESYHIKWEYLLGERAETPIAIYQDRLYVLLKNGEIHAIDLQTGKGEGVLKTNLELPGFIENANFQSRGLVANKDILIATFNDKNVWAFCKR